MIPSAEQPQAGMGHGPWRRRLWFFGRLSLVLVGIGVAKLLLHRLAWEVLAPNPLFPALVASEVFLLGFLLNGVLLDYKESEKMLAELASALECLAMEARSVRQVHPEAEVKEVLGRLLRLSEALLAWMKEATPVPTLLNQLDDLQRSIEELAIWNPAPLQARLLLELANIRRSVYRMGDS